RLDELLDAPHDALADAADLAQRTRLHLRRDRLAQAFDRARGGAEGAHLERNFAEQLEHVGEIEERLGDGVVVHAYSNDHAVRWCRATAAGKTAAASTSRPDRRPARRGRQSRQRSRHHGALKLPSGGPAAHLSLPPVLIRASRRLARLKRLLSVA